MILIPMKLISILLRQLVAEAKFLCQTFSMCFIFKESLS